MAGQGSGKLLQVSTSTGGLPKRAVPQAQVSTEGVAGDRHRNTQVHGGPRQAVLWVTAEGLAELHEAGFTVAPGEMGENITTSGLDRRAVRTSQRYRVGEEVIIEVTKLRTPCQTLDRLFPGIGKFVYDAQCKANDASSPRWGLGGFYARVVRGGLLRPGAPVSFLDQDA